MKLSITAGISSIVRRNVNGLLMMRNVLWFPSEVDSRQTGTRSSGGYGNYTG